ncbi:conserved hypothetical protein [Aspergillus terreus NIH2624]|uniref:FAD/NAD(P)-binding domain-containing protein n=1 Tax=Aspergillus terreus (strain NIH 2624 / FGSC A1156) TaxID=341663 RepID=Q0CM11_ASPTN|nr:uncharacterized protein ATEG_05273 [Aspergillus terreus NIH2624]EAU34342.1 conserved hypothetical protein [Aspergillus terreus NIH2624]
MTVPSKDRIEPGSFNVPVGSFPPTCSSTSVDADKVASDIIAQLNAASAKQDYAALSQLFLEDGFWRDHLAISFEFRTIKGRQNIAAFLEEHHQGPVQLALDRSSALRAPHVGPIDAFGDVTGIEFFVTVTTGIGSGRGVVRLAEPQPGDWKIFTVFTSLQELKDIPENVDRRRPVGVQHGTQPDRSNWQDRRTANANLEGEEPPVLIIGAGQAGLSIAARLRMLNVDALVIDREDRIGDNWRRRYHQLVLHDPVWFDHLPYLPFPSTWPVFTPKDKLAEFLACYAQLLELNVWTRTTLGAATYSDKTQRWTIELQQRSEDGSSTTVRVVHPRHVIQATGHSGEKNMPVIRGMDSFRGARLCHSSEFPGAAADGRGRTAVVVGSCNSGHDIAQDYYEHGYDVTMVQRSSTCVVSSSAITDIGLKGLYEEGGPPVEDADLFLWSIPSELFKAQQVKVTAVQNAHDRATLDGLAAAGFEVDRGPDDAGLLMKYLQRGGGYYIDVGASRLIADGKIRVKQGVEISEVVPHGLRFEDGTELAADEIVFATGYQNMRTQARALFGDAVADRVDDVWGLDAEGEMRTMWRRSGHPGLWFMGGNLALCRYYSRLLAMQIKLTLPRMA